MIVGFCIHNGEVTSIYALGTSLLPIPLYTDHTGER
jgi:hypothetical protein